MSKQGFLIFLICFVVCGCKTTSNSRVSDTEEKALYHFPLDWIGKYRGELNILGSKRDTIKIDMELIIAQPDATGMYPWVLKYGDKDVRYYGLEVIDATRGHYLIDEYNGIKIDAYLRSNHLITDFEVMGSQLIFHYERKKDGIGIQVLSSLGNQYNISGGEIFGTDTIPPVKSYTVNGYQEGFLKQIN